MSPNQGVVVSDEEMRRTLLQPEVDALRGEAEAGGDLEDCRYPHLQGNLQHQLHILLNIYRCACVRACTYI